MITEAHWQAFCEVLGHPDWTYSPEFTTRLQRLRHAAQLDKYVEGWTSTQEAADVMHRLQAAGVPAGIVYRCSDLYNDPQLKHRGYFVELEHPAMGRTPYDGLQHRLSRTPGVLRPAPLMGQHNNYVLQELLGLSTAEVERLVEAEVVY